MAKAPKTLSSLSTAAWTVEPQLDGTLVLGLEDFSDSTNDLTMKTLMRNGIDHTGPSRLPNRLDQDKAGHCLSKQGRKVVREWVTRAFLPAIQKHLDDKIQSFASAVAFVTESTANDGSSSSTLDSKLPLHSDQSDFTVNVCLESPAVGGELEFLGTEALLSIPLSDAFKNKLPQFHRKKLSQGYALIHRGSHPHRVFSVSEGKRRHLIIWCFKDRDKIDDSLILDERWLLLFATECDNL